MKGTTMLSVNPLAVCCCGTIALRESFTHCPDCERYICLRSSCDCSCPLIDEDEDDAMRQGRRMLAVRRVLGPVRAVTDEVLTAILMPVLWAVRWYARFVRRVQ